MNSEEFIAVAKKNPITFGCGALSLILIGAIYFRTDALPKVEEELAEFLGKLKATKEGNDSLLDNSLILYGSGMGNPNVHDHINLPIIVAGGAAGGMKGGRHIRFDKPTPLANLHLTLLDKVGVRLDKFADSSGKLDELFEPLSI